MSLDGSAPIGTFNANSAPGAKQKAIGVLLLLVSVVFACYVQMQRSTESWVPIKGIITSATPVPGRGSHIDYIATFTVDGRDYTFNDSRYAPRYYTESTALKMLHTTVDLRYNPANPSSCMTVYTYGMNHTWAPVVPWLIGIVGVSGFFFLAAGCTAQPVGDATIQAPARYEYDR